jgi:pilus assembly protein CpaB
MNQRLMTILLSAFLIAAGASYIVYRLVGKQIGDNAKGRATRIVVATQNLEIGAVIKATDLKTADLVGDPPRMWFSNPRRRSGEVCSRRSMRASL